MRFAMRSHVCGEAGPHRVLIHPSNRPFAKAQEPRDLGARQLPAIGEASQSMNRYARGR
jgi:hypothetical protein